MSSSLIKAIFSFFKKAHTEEEGRFQTDIEIADEIFRSRSREWTPLPARFANINETHPDRVTFRNLIPHSKPDGVPSRPQPAILIIDKNSEGQACLYSVELLPSMENGMKNNKLDYIYPYKAVLLTTGHWFEIAEGMINQIPHPLSYRYVNSEDQLIIFSSEIKSLRVTGHPLIESM